MQIWFVFTFLVTFAFGAYGGGAGLEPRTVRSHDLKLLAEQNLAINSSISQLYFDSLFNSVAPRNPDDLVPFVAPKILSQSSVMQFEANRERARKWWRKVLKKLTIRLLKLRVFLTGKLFQSESRRKAFRKSLSYTLENYHKLLERSVLLAAAEFEQQDFRHTLKPVFEKFARKYNSTELELLGFNLRNEKVADKLLGIGTLVSRYIAAANNNLWGSQYDKFLYDSVSSAVEFFEGARVPCFSCCAASVTIPRPVKFHEWDANEAKKLASAVGFVNHRSFEKGSWLIKYRILKPALYISLDRIALSCNLFFMSAVDSSFPKGEEAFKDELVRRMTLLWRSRINRIADEFFQHMESDFQCHQDYVEGRGSKSDREYCHKNQLIVADQLSRIGDRVYAIPGAPKLIDSQQDGTRKLLLTPQRRVSKGQKKSPF